MAAQYEAEAAFPPVSADEFYRTEVREMGYALLAFVGDELVASL